MLRKILRLKNDRRLEQIRSYLGLSVGKSNVYKRGKQFPLRTLVNGFISEVKKTVPNASSWDGKRIGKAIKEASDRLKGTHPYGPGMNEGEEFWLIHDGCFSCDLNEEAARSDEVHLLLAQSFLKPYDNSIINGGGLSDKNMEGVEGVEMNELNVQPSSSNTNLVEGEQGQDTRV